MAIRLCIDLAERVPESEGYIKEVKRHLPMPAVKPEHRVQPVGLEKIARPMVDDREWRVIAGNDNGHVTNARSIIHRASILVAAPSVLTPPDHRMVDVAVATDITPACGTSATGRIVSGSTLRDFRGPFTPDLSPVVAAAFPCEDVAWARPLRRMVR